MLRTIIFLMSIMLFTAQALAQENKQNIFKLIRAGDIVQLKKLVAAGENIKQKDYKGLTPLMRAAAFGHTDIVKFLLRKGADVHGRDNNGNTPLKHAAWSDKTQIIDLLVAKGADLEAKNNLGTTAIWSAVITGRVNMVENMIGHGANMNVANQYGMSAIRFAKSRDEWALVKLLEASGAKEF